MRLADFGIAKYLVAAGNNSYLSVYCGSYIDSATKYFPEYDIDVGLPLGKMEVLKGYAFKREFEKATVYANCSQANGFILYK